MERYRVQNSLRSMSFQEQHRPSGGEARPLGGKRSIRGFGSTYTCWNIGGDRARPPE
jgi:hypothetical protein